MLSRWAEQAAYEYDLDDEQREKTRKAVVERWTKFLDENRDEIQPLANEFIEMRMELAPPDKQKVMEWASRARPIFEASRKQIEDGSTEFREILRTDQRLKFEIDAMQMKLGMGLASQKFIQWEKGEFEPDDFWEPYGAERDARRDERRERRKEREELEAQRQAKRKAIDDSLRDPVDLEMDAWERYVADFIVAYGLDAGQKTTVLSCLTELRDRALAHRERHREEIARLEERIADNSGSEQELADIKTQLEKLYGPIDEMFQELKTRLDQVPTGQQRSAATQIPTRDAHVGDRARTTAEGLKSNEPASIDDEPEAPKAPAQENPP